jgi:hypothetical protein
VPGESRTVSATYADVDLEGATPVIDVGGWNVLSPFETSGLRVSHAVVKPGELFHVTANIHKTGLDGSLVQLLVDGRPVSWKRLWARGRQAREVDFQLWLDTAGTHSVQLGDQHAAVSVVA